jgi:type III pantothenate kinase
MRFKALNSFTAKLPLLKYRSIDYLTGLSTEESILSGVINGVSAEIDGIISTYHKNYENLTVILSGGDYIYFDKRLKNNIFALPNIVLLGLNIILNFNDKKLD